MTNSDKPGKNYYVYIGNIKPDNTNLLALISQHCPSYNIISTHPSATSSDTNDYFFVECQSETEANTLVKNLHLTLFEDNLLIAKIVPSPPENT